ncbi:L-ascorbate oxidase [Aspergillus cavernicola]|uniref:L-ascorbate oxidase n=1 Tax=Aspergillus cavernicola TaxID=176166 RepID=A0ABR4J2V1_9EURO
MALLAIISWTTAQRQMVHDSRFQPHYILRITQETVSVACKERPSVLVNGTLPGPTIYMRENQTTWVRVYNDLQAENYTMHWHGLSQSTAPYSDGTPQVSQWPIKAHHFFDYEIHPKIGDAGTYFYHAHIGFKAVTAAGPIIVEEVFEEELPYDYDDERILFFSELFNKTDEAVDDDLTEPIDKFYWTGESEAILLNGKGYAVPDDVITTSTESEPDSTCGPEIITIEPDTTYRIRAIGGVALSTVAFAFEDHDNLSVIAVDSGYTQPANTDHIQVSGGQRFDFILHTKSEPELRKLNKTIFWIQVESRCRPLNSTYYALLSYNISQHPPDTIPTSPPTTRPLSIPYDASEWLEYTLRPLKPNNLPPATEVTRQVFLSSAQFLGTSGRFWTINNHTWTENNQHEGGTPYNDTSTSPAPPYLVNIYLHGEAAIPDYNTAVQKYGGWDPQLNVYAAKLGEVIDLILVNEPNGISGGFDSHPWHIHGDHVWDLGSGPGTYNATANEEKLQLTGYTPIQRDTSLLHKYTETDDEGLGLNYTSQGWRAWRLQASNAGVWMIHCHILQHMIMGMQSVWVVGNASEITRGRELHLVEGYLTFGGDAYGNASVDPLVTHYFDD